MRRKEKEITDRTAIDAFIRENRVCRLGLAEGNQPYVVPLNFGYQPPYLYFHSATEGRKLDILRKNPRVCFEFDEMVKLKKNNQACEWGAEFKSVIGEGSAELLTDPDEKRQGLDCIMAQYSGRKFEYPDETLEKTAVIRVTIDAVSAKAAG